MNLYEKIHKIMGEVKSLQKDGQVAFGNTRYNYLSESKTTEVFREKFVENKLLLLPVRATETKEGQVTHGVYAYRLINAESPEEYIDLMAGGQGHDSADKGSGKASSYAYKYLLWRTFAVPSNDDPDRVSSAEISATQKYSKEELDGTRIPTADEIETEQKKAWEDAKEIVLQKAKILGYKTEKAFGAKYAEKYGVSIADSTIRQLKQAIADLDKKINELDPTTN